MSKENMNETIDATFEAELQMAYKEMLMDEVPDLWNRIEAGYEKEMQGVAKDENVISFADHEKKTNKKVFSILATAAALMILMIPVGVMTMRSGMQRNFSKADVGNAVDFAADEACEDAEMLDFDSAQTIGKDVTDKGLMTSDVAAQNEAKDIAPAEEAEDDTCIDLKPMEELSEDACDYLLNELKTNQTSYLIFGKINLVNENQIGIKNVEYHMNVSDGELTYCADIDQYQKASDDLMDVAKVVGQDIFVFDEKGNDISQDFSANATYDHVYIAMNPTNDGNYIYNIYVLSK